MEHRDNFPSDILKIEGGRKEQKGGGGMRINVDTKEKI
jgi:hypothetical protein